MKRPTLFLLVIIFFQIGSIPLIGQNDIDTTFPTIENNPNINLDQLEEAKPLPKKKEADKKNKTAVSIGKSQSFFTNIIQGLLVVFVGILAWWLYQKWQNKKEKSIQE